MKLEEPKLCPTCEERILRTQETCGDHICESLRLFVLSAFSAKIRKRLKETTKTAQAA